MTSLPPSQHFSDGVNDALDAAVEFAGNVIRYSEIQEDDPQDHRSLLIDQAWGVVKAVRLAREGEKP